MIIAPKKILTIKLRAMGDTVLVTAPLLELRKQFPKAEIHVVVLKQWADLLNHHPAVQKVWTFERHPDPFARAKAAARLALQLRKENFDTVLNFHASPTSSMIAFATGAKIRAIHFHGHKDKNRYSTVQISGKGEVKPIIERDMDTVRALGCVIPEGSLPRIFLSEEEIQDAKQTLQRLKTVDPLLMLGLGASRPTKLWPLDRFASIAVSWCQEKQGSVGIITSESENNLLQRFLAELDRILSTQIQDFEERKNIRKRIIPIPPHSVRKLSALIAHCKLLLGNDSGPRHLAVALHKPTLTLFGPEHPYEWHPYPKDQHPYFFIEKLHCRKDADPGKPEWCGLNECIFEQHRCMTEIQTHQVLETLWRLAQ